MKAEEVPVDTTAAFWQPASPLNGGPVVALAADEAGNLFASGTGLYRRPAGGPGTDVEWGRKPSRLFTNTYTEELGRVPLFESYDRMTSAGNTVYASSRGFLLRSRNHGQSWVDVQRAILDFQGGASDIWGLAASDSTLYVSMLRYGLLRSHDAGVSWERVLPDQLVARNADRSLIERVNGLALTYDQEGRLYTLLGVVTEEEPHARYGTLRLFRLDSEPSGAEAWEELPAPPLAAWDLAVTSGALYAHGLVIEEGRGSYRLHVLPAGSDRWTPVPLPEWHLLHTVASEGGSVYTFGGSGLFRYDDGTWVDLQPPAKTNDLLEHDGHLWAATDRGIFVAEAAAAGRSPGEAPPTWGPAHQGIVHAFGDLVIGPDGLILGRDDSSVYMSRDGGLSWVEAYEGLPLYPAIRGVAADGDGTPFVPVSRRGLYRWNSEVERWTATDTSATAKNVQSVSGGSAIVTSANGTLILAAYPRDGVEGSLHRSEGGVFAPAQGPPAEGRVRGLAAAPEGALFALIEADDVRTLYTSNDDGISWHSVAVPVPDDAKLLHLDVGADGSVYLTLPDDEVALLRSRDGGTTWEQLGTAGLHYTTGTGRHYRGPGEPLGTPGGHVLLQTRGLVYYWSEAAARWAPLLEGLPTTAGGLGLLPTGHLQAPTTFGPYRSAYPVDRWIDAVEDDAAE